MKTNERVIVLNDRTADDARLRSVLHDWGYSEQEIQRLLSETSAPNQQSLHERVITPA